MIKKSNSELCGFLGPDVAGISTTIKRLTGILAPTSGTADLSAATLFSTNLKNGQAKCRSDNYCDRLRFDLQCVGVLNWPDWRGGFRTFRRQSNQLKRDRCRIHGDVDDPIFDAAPANRTDVGRTANEFAEIVTRRFFPTTPVRWPIPRSGHFATKR